jgi:hypothetical protein
MRAAEIHSAIVSGGWVNEPIKLAGESVRDWLFFQNTPFAVIGI